MISVRNKKKGDVRCLDNLRPISILSINGKVLEKFVKRIVVKYLEENNIFYELQYGFHEGRSTIDAVFHLADVITKNRNNGLYSSVAFFRPNKGF